MELFFYVREALYCKIIFFCYKFFRKKTVQFFYEKKNKAEIGENFLKNLEGTWKSPSTLSEVWYIKDKKHFDNTLFWDIAAGQKLFISVFGN